MLDRSNMAKQSNSLPKIIQQAKLSSNNMIKNKWITGVMDDKDEDCLNAQISTLQ